MGKIVNLADFRKKRNITEEKNTKKELEIPKIYIVKERKGEYNVLVKKEGKITPFNSEPIPKLSIAIYAASYCKDQLSEYMGINLSTDIILFDEKCSKELDS